MAVSKAIAKEALDVFRREQKKRTRGFYTGCFCDGCVQCMQLALESVEDRLNGGKPNGS